MSVHDFPPKQDLETRTVLKKLAEAHRHLAELKGAAATIPNESILVNTLGLQEAQASSEIENIVTTRDELFKAQMGEKNVDVAAKEVARYAAALQEGARLLKQRKFLTLPLILEVQKTLENNRAGFRKLPGTGLFNEQTGEEVYRPPQDHEVIKEQMSSLVSFINEKTVSDLDPLVKLALLHHQFESIHPFYDGNGRTGRILNVLYLVQEELLTLPVLYLSRYIVATKSEYYRLLQAVREDPSLWETWVLYMLEAVSETSQQTLGIIKAIKKLMQETKTQLRAEHPQLYSQDLLNNLFRHPYTKIALIMRDLNVSRPTATTYLEKLTASGYIIKQKIGRTNYYIHHPLVECLAQTPTQIREGVTETPKIKTRFRKRQ
jgi:Fic family protein